LISAAASAGETEKAEILEAHLAMLEDESFIDEMAEKIRVELLPAAAAARDIAAKYVAVFEAMDDFYMR
jgi:phosphotransferase system enzyme I (PtsI)